MDIIIWFGLMFFLLWILTMPTNKSKRVMPTPADIATRAKLYWEVAGKPSGRDKEFWFEAEADMLREIIFYGEFDPVNEAQVWTKDLPGWNKDLPENDVDKKE